MDCENCRHLTVVGLHDTGPRRNGNRDRGGGAERKTMQEAILKFFVQAPENQNKTKDSEGLFVLFLGRLTSNAYLRDESSATVLLAATLRKKLLIERTFSPRL